MVYDIYEVKKILENNRRVVVEFIKKDGTLRTMICTRNFYSSSFKEVNITKMTMEKSGMRYNPLERGLIPVWDLEKQDWRMINVRTMQDLKIA